MRLKIIIETGTLIPENVIYVSKVESSLPGVSFNNRTSRNCTQKEAKQVKMLAELEDKIFQTVEAFRKTGSVEIV